MNITSPETWARETNLSRWKKHLKAVVARDFENALGIVPITGIADRIIKDQVAIIEQIAKEAIEHWPDAENWPVIIHAQEYVEKAKGKI